MITNHVQIEQLIHCFLDHRKDFDFIEDGAAEKLKASAIWASENTFSIIDAIEKEYDKLHRPRGSVVAPWGKAITIKAKRA